MASATNNRGAVATVRIAPIEHWCEDAAGSGLNAAIRQALLRRGRVSILTSSMEVRGDDHGRFWMIEPNCKRIIDAEAGREARMDTAWACEHMLEMD